MTTWSRCWTRAAKSRRSKAKTRCWPATRSGPTIRRGGRSAPPCRWPVPPGTSGSWGTRSATLKNGRGGRSCPWMDRRSSSRANPPACGETIFRRPRRELVHEGDCLRLDDAAGHMVVWPPLHSPHFSDGAAAVTDGDGVTVARVGDRLEMTGFGSELMRPLYADRCPGPYWIVGRIARRR